MGRAKPPPSLLQRAVAALARREHSRAELARKLRRHLPQGADPAEIDRVLDELAGKGMLSEARFAASLVRTRAGRFGASRVRQELKQHGVAPELVAQATADLAKSELARAREVWRKRFGVPPRDDAERAKQLRFLASRGFSTDVILRVVRGIPDDG
ncbi:MAG: recombination regulator RecX [Burkholderiaceae bacterium]